MPDDYSADIQTTGVVAVGGIATGTIDGVGDRDWFAVELVAGRTYTIDLRGSPTDDGTLSDPYLRGIHDAGGTLIAGTTNDDGGEGYNSRLTFTATESRAYYIAAGAYSGRQGTYELEVTDTTPPPDDFADTAATNGIIEVGGSATGEIGEAGDFDWFALDVVAGRTYVIDLEGSETDAGTLENPQLRGLFNADDNRLPGTTYDRDGGEGLNSRMTWTATETGTVYVAARGHRDDTGTYTLLVTDISPQAQQQETVNAAPAFGQASYAFSLAENEDGSVNSILLGTVAATDPDNDPVTYSIVGGDPDGLFLIEAETGFLLYVGPGEDYESGTTSHNLTVRASDGTNDTDTTVTVNVTDAVEPTEGADVDITDGRATAIDLGDITGLTRVFFPRGTLDDGADAVAWYRFELSDARRVGLGLRELSADADLIVEDADGNVLHEASRDGTANEWLLVTLLAGTYYVRLEAQEAGSDGYMFRYGVSEPDVGEVARLEAELNGTPLVGVPSRVIDYSDAKWANEEFNYGAGWAGRGFGLTGSQRGAPEEIEIAEVDGVTALRFSSAERNQSWYDEHAGAVGHGVHGYADSEPQDDFMLPGIDWRTGDNPYLIAQVHLGGPQNTTTLRMVAMHETESGGEQRTFPGIIVQSDYIGLRGPGRSDIGVSPPDLPHEGWVTLGMTVTDSGDIVYVGRYGTHSLAELFAEPDFRYLNSEVSHSARPYVPLTRGNSGMFSQVMHDGHPNAIAYIEFGRDLALDAATATAGITDDHPGSTDTGAAVAVEGSVAGEIEYAGDRDWFAVTLEAGKTYRIDLEGSSTGAGTLDDPYLGGVYDADGFRIYSTANDSVPGGNSRSFFTPTEDATYYVSAGADGNDTGTYTLSVTEIVDDFAAGPATIGTVTIGGPATGTIEYAHDFDWFAVTLEAGKTYRIDLEGSSTGAGTHDNPYLGGVYDADYLRGVYDADGFRIYSTANDSVPGGNSRSFFTPTEDATYYVSAGDNGNDTGTYTLSVTEAVDDFAAGTRTTGTVPVGGSATGTIEYAHDFDWFAMTLEAGKTYRIDLEGSPTGVGTLEAPYLGGVYDTDGHRLPGTSDDDAVPNVNSRVDFTATEDTTYYVAAGSFYYRDYGAFVGTYELSVEEVL